MKIYIAGSISNDPDYIEKFAKAENRLAKDGHIVFNPAKNQGESYKEYVDMGFFQLMHCEAIYLLKGYENSKGALLEKHYAETVGLIVLFEAHEIISRKGEKANGTENERISASGKDQLQF